MNRCALCPSQKLPIDGEGPIPCRIAIFGEAPGRTEDRVRDENGRGRPFHGDAGQDLNRLYLRLAGLKRDEVYVSNCVKCLPGDDEVIPPNPRLASCCSSQWVGYELRRVQPEILVTLGAVAYRTLFPGYPSLDIQHGIPIRAAYRDWEGILIPMWHPAAALRSPDVYMAQLSEDWRRLGAMLRLDTITPPVDEYPDTNYFDCTSASDVSEYLNPYGTKNPLVAIDTETDEGKLYCLSASVMPGTAIVIHRDSTDALAAFSRRLQLDGYRTIYHNAAYDHPVLLDAGVHCTPSYVDTMVMCYSLGPGHPQGLKALAYRLCGMEMSDFDDVVRPYAVEAFKNWLAAAIRAQQSGKAEVGFLKGVELPDELLPPVWLGLPKSKRGKMYREWLLAAHQHDVLAQYRGKAIHCYGDGYVEHFVKAVNTLKLGNERQLSKANNLLQSMVTKGNNDPWDRIKKWEDNTLAILESRTGRYPRLSIRYAPWQESLYYSARDADATLRVYHQLQRTTPRAAHRYSIPV